MNSVNNYGVTTLMAALYVDNNTEMIKYLIENGVDVNAKNSDNASAIMMAAASVRDPDIIELFIVHTTALTPLTRLRSLARLLF